MRFCSPSQPVGLNWGNVWPTPKKQLTGPIRNAELNVMPVYQACASVKNVGILSEGNRVVRYAAAPHKGDSVIEAHRILAWKAFSWAACIS